jgi:xylulokinase
LADAVLGVDVGTSSLKAGLLTLDGVPLGLAEATYPLSVPEEDANEQNPEDWWTALAKTSRELLTVLGDANRLIAVCIGGQAPTLAPTDDDFRPSHPAITWLDSRPSAEADRMYARLSQPVPVWGSWPSQAAWFMHNRPEALRRTRWLFGCPDYLASRLTRTPAALLSISDGEIEAGDLDPFLIPPAWTPGQVIGDVDPGAAAETGLAAGTPVVGGHVDGLLGVLGSGVRELGDACMNAGTSGTFSTVCLPPLGYQMFDLQVAGSATNTSGKALDWFAHKIIGPHAVYSELLDEAATVPAGSEGLLFLPHLAGERGAERDPYSRGAWVGLTLGHQRRHLGRSVLEGVAFSFRSIQDWLEASGAPVGEVRCVGGQARSDVWNQIKSDVLNRPLLVPEMIEAAVVGAAILGAVGVGAYESTEDAQRAMVRLARRYAPDAESAATYERLLTSYRGLYPALRETNWRLHDVCIRSASRAVAPGAAT